MLRVVVDVVALLCPLFLYQNAVVLYLNVDVAIFGTERFWDQPKNHGDFGATSRKIFLPQERVLFAPCAVPRLELIDVGWYLGGRPWG